jgi:hypothetical protein
MACCGGTATFFYCYPTTCPSPDFCCCDFPCSGCCFAGTCGGANYTARCSDATCTSTCGQGACCTCNSQQLGFAIQNGTPAECFWTVNCGQPLWFASANCFNTAEAPRVDYNGTASRIVDMTPALFATLGGDFQAGLLTVGADNSNSGFYSCPCP